jgi:hypothetical protein
MKSTPWARALSYSGMGVNSFIPLRGQIRGAVSGRSKLHKHGRNGPIVGLATEVRAPGSGSSLDAILLIKPDWSDADTAFVEEVRRRGDFVSNPIMRRASADEFPAV